MTDKDGELLPGTLEYYAETGDPEDETVLGRDFKTNEDLLLDERTIAKPIVVTYYDEVEYDAYTNDGIPDNTQAALRLSLGGAAREGCRRRLRRRGAGLGRRARPRASLRRVRLGVVRRRRDLEPSTTSPSRPCDSSFTLKDGTVYPGTVDYGVKHAMAGNKILVVWHSKYAMQGSPRYSL